MIFKKFTLYFLPTESEKFGGKFMKLKKLRFSDEDKIELQKLREKLAAIEMNDEELSGVYAAGGCGGFCQITCSFYCEPGCERSCSASCFRTCSDIVAEIGGGCIICNLLKIIQAE